MGILAREGFAQGPYREAYVFAKLDFKPLFFLGCDSYRPL